MTEEDIARLIVSTKMLEDVKPYVDNPFDQKRIGHCIDTLVEMAERYVKKLNESHGDNN